MPTAHPTGRLRGRRLRCRLSTALAVAGLAAGVAAIAAVGTAAPGGTRTLGPERAQVRALEAEVADIDARAAAAADAAATAIRRRDELRGRIADTGRRLAETRRDRRTALQRLSDRLVGIYTQPTPTLVEVLLTSGGLAEAVETQQALEVVGEQDRAVLERIDAARTRLAALRETLRADRAAADASVAETVRRRDQLRSLIGARRAALADARGRLDRVLEADARARSRARAADREAEAALERRAAGDAAAPAAPTTGAVAAPLSTPAPAGDVAAALARIAQCESGGDPRAVSSSGLYRGKYQFAVGTWQGLGGVGDPAAAPEAEQDRIAAILYARSGPAPWPVCGYR